MATDDETRTDADSSPEPGRREPTARFRHLPERIRPEDMVEEQDTDAALPFDGGRNAANEYLIRHLIG